MGITIKSSRYVVNEGSLMLNSTKLKHNKKHKIMNLSTFKEKLESLNEVNFVLPDGQSVPAHFHITEIGQVQKHFIDCGGNIRQERIVNFQLFTADDYDHRLEVDKLCDIISLAEDKLGLADGSIEIEYQGETIEKYGLGFANGTFQLLSKKTDCLAKDKCGIAPSKTNVKLKNFRPKRSDCVPESGCC